MQNTGAHGHLKRDQARLKRDQARLLDSLPISDSLRAPTERCLSKIAHRNDRASRDVDAVRAENQILQY